MGGAYFIFKNIQLVLDTNKKTAMRCFLASLVQLTAVLVGAMLDLLV